MEIKAVAAGASVVGVVGAVGVGDARGHKRSQNPLEAGEFKMASVHD